MWCVFLVLQKKKKQRNVCNANAPVRSWVPSTLVTMTNALTALYMEGPDLLGAVVLSVQAHFPQYCAFVSNFFAKKQLASQNEDVPLLWDEEIVQLHNQTNCKITKL